MRMVRRDFVYIYIYIYGFFAYIFHKNYNSQIFSRRRRILIRYKMLEEFEFTVVSTLPSVRSGKKNNTIVMWVVPSKWIMKRQSYLYYPLKAEAGVAWSKLGSLAPDYDDSDRWQQYACIVMCRVKTYAEGEAFISQKIDKDDGSCSSISDDKLKSLQKMQQSLSELKLIF